MKVYLVSIGRWSDYYVYAIYSTEENAKKAVEKYTQNRSKYCHSWGGQMECVERIRCTGHKCDPGCPPHKESCPGHVDCGVETFELDGGPKI